jgi:hypothetical protein
LPRDSEKGLDTYTPVDKDVYPDLPVEERILDVLPLELVGLGNLRLVRVVALTLVLEAVDDKRPLLLGEEVGRLGEVVQREERNDSDDDGRDAFREALVSNPSGRPAQQGGNLPSRIKIHCHPCSPATWSIFPIANANSPLNAPATLAALKNMACRSWISSRRYQFVR